MAAMDAGPEQRAGGVVPATLIPEPEELYACGRRLYPAWMDYCTNVSLPNMAMSLNACAYILWLTEKLRPACAADFGSGFTSYTLRLACDNVWSVDDNDGWLAQTRKFVRRYRLHDDNIVSWDDYQTEPHTHDLIVYDFGNGGFREANMSPVVANLTPAGVAVFDDAQHLGHQTAMRDAADDHGRPFWSLRDWTIDEVTRFAAMIGPQ